MGKPYSQYGGESMVTSGLEELRGQVVVPEELRFPHACCVGIASQTSLSLFNPSERWQQVSITVASLAVDGEQVDSLPYQWLIVKNKTIIGPKSTEEQKVLFVPPQPGVYQCVLSVCSWPASAETELAARAGIFAKRVVLIAVAENPALEVLVVLSEVFPSRPSLEQQESMLLKIYSLLTVLVLPSGPQYEVTLKGEAVPSDSGKPVPPSAPIYGPSLTSDVPPILSNKQFVAWGGVTLGRAV
ncbi:hypothetical protein GOODEAATRI_010787 [Goodea atripinnis]|uniref:Cep192-like domain-containing protein n=1 Tax=Goodea atripinnis TaxID=208336 RepID=A0ABV0N1S9_9TELE